MESNSLIKTYITVIFVDFFSLKDQNVIFQN